MNQTAQGLAALGRGPDTQLVHMAPGEVKSLQQLAMAHGGSLTINPQTGLPEAGFLSSLLPMLIGGGLTIASGGALSPLMAGLITGGGFGLATGSLKKGLMAGLGAYGGAGLGSALAGSGVQAAANTQIAGDAAYKTAQEAMQQQATALGQNALPYTPEGFAAQARDLTAPLNTMRDAALTSQQTAFANASPFAKLQTAGSGISNLTSGAGRDIFMDQIGGSKGLMQAGMMAAAPMMMETTTKQPEIKTDKDMGQRYQFNAGTQTPTPNPDVPGYGDQSRNFGREQRYFNPTYTPIDKDAAKKLYGFAEGGEVDSYTYDPVTQMYIKKGGQGATVVSPTGGISGASAGASGSDDQPLSPQTLAFLENETPAERDARMGQVSKAIEGLIGFAVPGAGLAQMARDGHLTTLAGGIANAFSPPGSQPNYGVPVDSRGTYAGMPEMGKTSYESGEGNPGESVGGYSGSETQSSGEAYANAKGGLLARGGISHLGDYSDGGRLLRGPGDGISDSIPAMIGKKQPARLADGEFVVPARIVSELGNGSTEAGARKLYAMMDRVQKARGKTVGKGRVATNSRAAKHLPA